MDAKYSFELKGTMPLLMHMDDVDQSDELTNWRKDPANKNFSVPGDDRSPPWTWQTYLYSDGTHLTIPSWNLQVAVRQAGTQLILKRQKTFKEITQSGLLITAEFLDFYNREEQVPIDKISKIRDWPYKKQADKVQEFGFKLFCKRAAVGRAKHIRVRARFDNWSVRGTVTVTAPEITQEILTQLFERAGRVGLGDWRPGCSTPGPYGMFSAVIKKG